jgi:hypothetical protein
MDYLIVTFSKDPRGIKIRGYYKTLEEAEKSLHYLTNIGLKNIFICEYKDNKYIPIELETFNNNTLEQKITNINNKIIVPILIGIIIIYFYYALN